MFIGEIFCTIMDFLSFFIDLNLLRLIFMIFRCHICKNFKPHFIQLGKRIQELASSGNSSSDSVQIDIHAVSCAPNRPLCRALAIDQYPYFRIFLPGDTQGFDVPHAQVNPTTILQKMGIKVDETTESNQILQDEDTYLDSLLEWGRSAWKRFYFGESPLPKGKVHFYRSRENLRDDIHLSFDFAMRQGVFLSDTPLPSSRAEVLFVWLLLLRKTLPVSWSTLHSAVQNLIDNFDYVKRSESYMITILDEYAPPSKVWSMSCSHGEIDAGFTCGLWELFHSVTVGVVDYNRAAAFHRNRLATEDVARTIRSFVDAFFPCEICRRNFAVMFDSCAYRRCEVLQIDISEYETDWIQLSLWLLDTHNGVSVRLMKEKAERENKISRITVDDEIAVKWPSLHDCPQCWLPSGSANQTTMYKFLKLEYGQRDDMSSEYKQELEASKVIEEIGDDVEPFAFYTQCAKFVYQVVSPIAALMNTAFSNQPESKIITLESRRSDLFMFLKTSMLADIFPAEANEELASHKNALLKDWLDLLRKTLPASWHEFHSLIQELLDNWAYVTKNREYLIAVLDEFPTRSKQWSSSICIIRGKSEVGHMCAMLEIYHVIAVGLVHYNKFVASDSSRLATANVAHILHRYVAQFFKYSLGGEIIESMAQMCSPGSCKELLETPGTELDWVYLPLWVSKLRHSLSQEHSLPATRISSASGSPVKSEPLHRWPPPHQCSRCWIDGENWDADHVYKYSLRAYGQESVLTIGVDEDLLSQSNSNYESPLQGFVLWIGSFFPMKNKTHFSELKIEEMFVVDEEL